MQLIFGFDIGATSIGFAVVDLDEARQAGEILRHGLGARIFPEAREPDGTPLNQQRRAKRMMRRQLRHRRQRRRALSEFLSSHGLLPPYGGDAWNALMNGGDPYALRTRALSERLEPYELGRALYHLAKRRHFKERDAAESEQASAPQESDDAKEKGRTRGAAKSASEEEKQEAEQRQKREHFVAALRASGETLGQALAKRGALERKRGEHATRAVVQEEFSRIIAAQAAYHSALQDKAFKAELEEILFAQRPVFWRKSTLGRCALMPGEALCPKGSWLSQQRRMLEKVNNLALAGGNARPLDAEERAAIVATLETQNGMSWGGVRDVLKPIFKARGESSRTVKFNHEVNDEGSGLKGNAVEAALARVFGVAWTARSRKAELRAFLPQELWRADYGEVGEQRVVIRAEKERAERRAAVKRRLAEEFGVSAEQAEALTKLHFPQGWEPYCTKALEKILPELEKGERFGTLINSPDRESWRNENFPNRERPTGEILDRLPSPRADRKAQPEQREEMQRLGKLRNPTVVRVQNELRKVVNNLIGLYGKPDLIRIELAREIGLSKKEREERTNGMRARERQRETARKDLLANDISDPSREDIEKWLLWKECGETCPYSGARIGFDDLFRKGLFQVEHIWPRSKSLDDSFRNKTLCRVDVNTEKGDRIPFEYFGNRPDDWAAAKDRVWKMVGPKAMAPGKARRFCSEKMLEEGFAARQLNDTGYAARQARAMLQRLWPDEGPTTKVNVQPVSGRVTAQLRKLWGLNHILGDDGEKNRADHRHHAIDALVVACAHGGYANKLSRYLQEHDAFRRGHGRKPTFDAERPWSTIREDAQAATDEIIVSHRVRKKVSGPLHLETVYGDTGIDEVKGRISYRYFVTRKPVERLSKTEIGAIVDARIRTVVQEWVDAHGGDPKKAFSAFPRVSETGPEIRKVRLRMPQQLALMAPVSTGYSDRGENHHIAIWRAADGEIDSEVVSLFDAARRLARKQPVVRRDRNDDATFLMSLSRGDTLQFPEGKMHGLWIVQGVWASKQIVLWRATDATGATVTRPKAASIVAAGAHKMSVDPIGRKHLAND